jgi:hypothetical protein
MDAASRYKNTGQAQASPMPNKHKSYLPHHPEYYEPPLYTAYLAGQEKRHFHPCSSHGGMLG